MSKETIAYKRTIVIGDIHSSYLAVVDVLKKVKPTKEDLLIFLGDYTDGWADVIRTLKLLMELKKKFPHYIFIKGNHDEWLLKFCKTGIAEPSWLRNGGKITHRQLLKEFDKTPEFRAEVQSFLESLVDYYVDDDNRAYIHAGWRHQDGINRANDNVSNFYWDRTLWNSCLKIYTKKVPDGIRPVRRLKRFRTIADSQPERLKRYHEVFIGHTSTVGYGKTRPMKLFNLYNLDSGAGWHGRLSAMNVKTKTTWQSEFVKKLYPNDPHGWKGRPTPEILTEIQETNE